MTVPDPLTALIVGLCAVAGAILLVWPGGGLIGHRRRLRQLSARVLGEDVLKQICTAELEGYQATLQSVAGALELSANQVAQVLADLEKRGMVSFGKNELHLTQSGREYGLHIIRTHRLWEKYLAEETGLSEAEWHRHAHQLEHMFSPPETSDLSERLGNPTHDPHGDPIPTASGEFVRQRGVPLTDAPLHQPLRIVHIEDEPEAVYTQIVAEELYPGTMLRVLEKTPQRIRFWAEGAEHVLAPIFASAISVATLPEVEVQEAPSAMRLTTLKPGEKAKVLALSRGCRGPERRRLLDLGFVPGTVVEVGMVSPGGDPTAYRVRGALIALRREQASLIHVAPTEEVAA